jgi:arylsulfatase A-like enzyme
MSPSGSGPNTSSDKVSHNTSLSSFWRREFSRREPTRVADLVLLPLAVSASAGLILGVCSVASQHFLDPGFVAYSVAVYVGVQILILFLALLLALAFRRRIWSGVLFAIAAFSVLVIPEAVEFFLPGVAHWMAWIIGLIGAFQIARTLNRHSKGRFLAWMIAVPAIVTLCAASYGRVREFAQLQALPAPPNSPNVLIIIVDALRADHLQAYGYTRDTSPYIALLAQQGVVFENAIAPSSWTLPSHASILTGLYPNESGVSGFKDILSGDRPTLGDALRNRGYRTGAFSANYLFFSKSRGFIHGFSHFEESEQSFGAILEEVPISHFILGQLSRVGIGGQFTLFGVKSAPDAEKIDEDAMAWIDKGHRPFFAVLNYYDVHEPALPPESYLHMYSTDRSARRESLQFQENCIDGSDPSCDPDRPQFLATYDGAMRYVDDNIEHLLSQLDKQGRLQNTIVVLTSDHGQEFGDHGLYGHGKSLYRSEIQVPLIIWKPGLVPPSVRLQTPVSTTDIPATILDLTATAGTQTMPGRSLAALWKSSEPVSGWPEPISELARLHWFSKNAPNYNNPVSSIVTPQWQFIRQGDKDLLFDWKTDPDETHDLCPSQPAVCPDLQNRLQATQGSRHYVR